MALKLEDFRFRKNWEAELESLWYIYEAGWFYDNEANKWRKVPIGWEKLGTK